MIDRVALAHLPTPLQPLPRLSERLGVDLWVKRDDATGGPEAGNKIRKLEYLLAEAQAQGADTLLTCGGVQSNHARTTAIVAARLGMRCVLLLRAKTLEADDDGRGVAPTEAHAPAIGNVLLDRMVGAEVRLITAASYGARDRLLEEAAEREAAAGRVPYVIPEGGSNGRGAFGYVRAMAEVAEALDGAPPFDRVVHACGSGGTAAGIALGASLHGAAKQVHVMAVCDDAPTFEARIAAIIDEARAIAPALVDPAPWHVDDSAKGEAYAVSSPAQREVMVEVARLTGLALDPVYSGKAMHGLWRACESGALRGERILFLHTGGLPGLLAQADTFADEL